MKNMKNLLKIAVSFDININVSNGSGYEYIDVMSFLSKEDVESVRKLILERITENVEDANRKFAEL